MSTDKQEEIVSKQHERQIADPLEWQIKVLQRRLQSLQIANGIGGAVLLVLIWAVAVWPSPKVAIPSQFVEERLEGQYVLPGHLWVKGIVVYEDRSDGSEKLRMTLGSIGKLPSEHGPGLRIYGESNGELRAELSQTQGNGEVIFSVRSHDHSSEFRIIGVRDGVGFAARNVTPVGIDSETRP